MSLTQEQYDGIMRGYAERRAEHQRVLSARKEQIYREIPKFRELEDSVPATAAEALRVRLNFSASQDSSAHSGFPAAGTLKHTLQEIRRCKCELLTSAGYPADYLDMKYDCPDCRDTGFIHNEKCHCFKQQEISILYNQSHLEVLVQEQNFDSLTDRFYTGEDLKRFRYALMKSQSFVQNFNQEYNNLYFYGTVGTGKSFLSVCIAKEILESGHSVLYFSSASLFDRLSTFAFNYQAKSNMRSLLDDLYECDLLIIDDLGTELTNQFVSAQLFACLNERHLNKKATVISTNLSLEELQNRYSDRVFSRITSNFTLCKLSGRDIRLLRRRQWSSESSQRTTSFNN